jgi:hypothetical protein
MKIFFKTTTAQLQRMVKTLPGQTFAATAQHQYFTGVIHPGKLFPEPDFRLLRIKKTPTISSRGSSTPVANHPFG